MDAMEMNKMINDNWQMEKAMVKQKIPGYTADCYWTNPRLLSHVDQGRSTWTPIFNQGF